MMPLCGNCSESTNSEVSESSVNPESLMDDSAVESSLNNCDSDLETPGSTSEISTPVSPVICRAQCCDLDKPIQVDKNAIRSNYRERNGGNSLRIVLPMAGPLYD